MLERIADRADDGQGLLEYGLLLALVSLAAVAGLLVLGTTVVELFETVPVPFLSR